MQTPENTETNTVQQSMNLRDYSGHACRWNYEVSDFTDPVKGGGVIELHARENQEYLDDIPGVP